MQRENVESLLRDPKRFRGRVSRRLRGGEQPLLEKMRAIREALAGEGQFAASAVLVPLEFRREANEYVIVLNKRSDKVQQPGDLCCPGGRLDFGRDRFFSRLMAWRTAFFSLATGILHGWRPHRRAEKGAVRLVLAGALRESWEEMGLAPWKVKYLGVLPPQHIQNRPRIIFPVVGEIRGRWRERPNREVGKILRLPVRAFFDPDRYVLFRLNLPESTRSKFGVDRWEVPGLSVLDNNGEEEILWGATFRILLTFLERTLDLSLTGIHPKRTVERDLPEDYYRH